MRIEDQLIDEIKPFVETGNLAGIILLWEEFRDETDFGRVMAWDYIFQKIYLYAALKKQKEICGWLDTVFLQFDPIQQIAMRQMFPYANYLLNKS